MLKRVYVEFKTWAEGKVDVPWTFVTFEETNDYRTRQDLSSKVPQKILQSTFLSLNQDTLKTFFDKNINAIILGAEVFVGTHDEILPNLQKVFGYCEILGWCEITAENQSRIELILADAKK